VARADREEWAKVVQRWQDSGLTAREFASEMGLKATTLSYWKWRLKRESEPSFKEARRGSKARSAHLTLPRFVEVSATKTESVEATHAPLELVMARCVVRIPNGFDDNTLRRVLALLAEQV
jgi:hypothetical protein